MATTTKKIQFKNVKEDNTARGGATTRRSSSSSSISTENKSLGQILRDTRAGDIPLAPDHKPVVEVRSNMTPLACAKVLWENKILAAPVWSEAKQRYVGFFDMRDLISLVLLSRKKEETGKDDVAMTSWFPDHFTASYVAARNPFVADYDENSSLLQVCKALCRNDAHNVPLIDPSTKRCVRILSQSTIVQFLAQHVTDAHFPLLKQTLQEAKFPYKKEVVQAPDTASARHVFQLMEKRRLSGIAIVDSETGKHIGNTSAVDIKLAVRLDDADQLVEADIDMDILSYLAAVRQESATPYDSYPSAHIKESSTVGHALKLLAKTGLHRIFVVDENVRPVGVVSVTDIVQFVVDHAD